MPFPPEQDITLDSPSHVNDSSVPALHQSTFNDLIENCEIRKENITQFAYQQMKDLNTLPTKE
jgi:hypothetical protein